MCLTYNSHLRVNKKVRARDSKLVVRAHGDRSYGTGGHGQGRRSRKRRWPKMGLKKVLCVCVSACMFVHTYRYGVCVYA